MELLGQATGLAAEDEHDILRLAERRVPKKPRRFRREEERFAEPRQLLLERLPARPHSQIDVLPVVESCALHLALVEREAERLDEMQRRAGGETRPSGVAGVPVNLRMHENDVNHFALSISPSRTPRSRRPSDSARRTAAAAAARSPAAVPSSARSPRRRCARR